MNYIISKNKFLFIAIIVCFAFLSNFYLIGEFNQTINHLSNDYWSQVINDLSNQAVIVKDHRPDFSFIYKPFKLHWGIFKLFQFADQVSRVFIQTPVLPRIIGLFFWLYYQLSRTSSESDPSNFSYPLWNN
jgi:hypothetical protein